MMAIGGAATLLIICGAIAAALIAVMAFIYILIPMLKGIGWSIGKIFWLIGVCISHVFRFIAGVFVDTFRAIGALPAVIIFALLAMGSVVIGRWSAAAHFGSNVQKEVKTFGGCIYRIALGHPLRLLGLKSMLEGIEERVPAALAEAPGSDKPSRRVGVFDGYEIVGSLPGGGSGGKLYIAEPRIEKRGQISKAFGQCPGRVVIKSFATSEGSSIPQIVRESRALESAKQLGLILDHELDDKRFYYVMPYVPGESMGAMARHLHARRGAQGLQEDDIRQTLGYIGDVLNTLSVYHRGGLWHKDIKPENVIISEDGRAHVVDLGLVTPLRSAMTLTTHGTEYFRDPEMVRMALNGVKVNEIDGTKFDIYAAGAVLFFMMENTFPSHGGLSTITKPCPEAMKWIVRRAMTDYSKRYTSAEEMYEDVKAVATHAHMYSMRPADLPSLRGSGVASVQSSRANDLHAVGEVNEQVAFAGVAHDQSWESVYGGASGKSESSGPWNREPERKKFKFKVTNWWTGAYQPVGVSAGYSNFKEVKQQLKDVRKQVRKSAEHARASVREVKRTTRGGLRHAARTAAAEAQRVREEVRAAVGTPCAPFACGSGLSASEQVARAKARAAELRRHARSRMGRRPVRGPGERVSRGMLAAAFIVAVFVVIAAGVMIPLLARRTINFNATAHAIIAQSPVLGTPDAPSPMDEAQLRSFYGIVWPADIPMRYLVVNDHPQPNNEHVAAMTKKLNASMVAIGFSPEESEDNEAKIRARVGQYLSGAYAVSSGESTDDAEDAVSNLLKSSLSGIGCVVWLYPMTDQPDRVGYWVMTRDATTTNVDDQVLKYLQKTAR